MICGRFNRCSVAQGSLSALNRDRNLLFVPPLLWANYCLVDLSLNIFTCKTRALNLSTGASVPLSRNKSNNGWNRIGKEWVMSRKCLAHCATWNEGLNCKLSKWTITLTSGSIESACAYIESVPTKSLEGNAYCYIHSAAEGTKQWYARSYFRSSAFVVRWSRPSNYV